MSDAWLLVGSLPGTYEYRGSHGKTTRYPAVDLKQPRVPLAESPRKRAYGAFSSPRCVAAAKTPDGPAISISPGFTRECSRNTSAGTCSRSLDRRKPIVSFQSSSASLARLRSPTWHRGDREALWWRGISHPIASIDARVNAAYLASLLCHCFEGSEWARRYFDFVKA